MEKIIKGKAFVLTDNIDTDQIIPAEHLVYSTSDENELKMYGKFALSGVPKDKSGMPEGNIPFVLDGGLVSGYEIIIAGSNFGCGSSREHAPLALKTAGVKAVIAESYARIFYRNSVDGGFVIPIETGEKLCNKINTGDFIEINLENNTLKNHADSAVYNLRPLCGVYDIVNAGGLFNYARQRGIIK